MADIFKEVDEELRRDQAEKLWKKYGRYVIAVAALVVLAVAGLQLWRTYELDRRQELSDRYAAALELAADGDTTGALDVLGAISDASASGYPGLAALEQARLRAESGDTAGAIAIWDRIAADSSLGEGFRGAATLLSVLHQMDEGDPAELRGRLAPLAAEGRPYRASANELLAVLALRDGDRAGAQALYERIVDDPEAPAGLRNRAAQMLAAIKE